MRRLARHVPRLLLGTLVCAGWLALILALVLLAAEKTGLLARGLREVIAARLGSLGQDLSIREARLRWFQLAVEIDGIELGAKDELARLESVRLEFDVLGALGPRLARADVRGGKIRVSRALLNGLESYTTSVTDRTKPSFSRASIPAARVDDVDVELSTTRFGVLPLGRIDAFLRGNDRMEPELWGRMIPSLAASAASSGEIYLHGKVREPGTFEVNATATRLPVGTDYLPAGSELDFMRAYQPHGWLDLDAWALFALDGSVAPRARGRLSISDGDALISGGKQRVDRLRLDLGGSWTPESVSDWSSPRAWQAQMKVLASVAENPLEATAILGPDAGNGLQAKAWLHAPRLQLSRDLLDLFGDNAALLDRWNAFDPRGAGELWVGARLPLDFVPGDKLTDKIELLCAASLDGAAGMTYRGFQGARAGVYDGFPLPLDQVRGDLVFARDPRRLRPYRLALVDLVGDGGASLIRANGTVMAHPVDVPPFAPSYGYADFDIAFSTRGLTVDDRLKKALGGLADVLPPTTTWEPFKPVGGKLDVDVRLMHDVMMSSLAIDVSIGMSDVGMTWKELPLPVTATRANLDFRLDGHSELGLAFALQGSIKTAQDVHVVARMQTDPTPSRPKGTRNIDDLLGMQVTVARASLTGDNRHAVSLALPEVGSALDDMAAKGFADVRYERTRARAGGVMETRVEVTPRDPVQLTPKQFQMITSDVRGRVIVESIDHGPAIRNGDSTSKRVETKTRLAPLVGTWDQRVQVAFEARFPERIAHIFGAGIDPASHSLLGSLRQAIQSPGDSSVDLSALRVTGQLDFTGEINVKETTDAKDGSRYRFFLRDNVLSSVEGFSLGGLSGELQLVDGKLIGEHLHAVLAKTPIELSGARFQSGVDGFRLETSFDATGVPIDREHLASFVDASTLQALVDELHWRGTIDVRGGKIVLSGPTQGQSKLELSGEITPHDMFVQLGLPLEIRSASATIESLIYEGGRVRSVVRIDAMEGQIADRALGPASLLVTYFEPNLSIESLTARFEGGELGPLGVDAARRGTVFSIGLEPPFPFQLALRMKNVDVACLVRGLFPSNIATRGHLDAQMRLVGDMDHLLGISGTGSIKVVDSRLWSIPVFRALFAQLGLDDTAVFDSMASNLTVKDGRIGMQDIILRSPLLQLVGSGSLDFDGAIQYDLDLRYALVDRLGAFTRLLYFIQNKLLSVSIRGDMARPEINLENPLSKLFGSKDRGKRALPLPAWTPLHKRF